MDIAKARQAIKVHDVITKSIIDQLGRLVDEAKDDYYSATRIESQDDTFRDAGFNEGLAKGFEAALKSLDRIPLDDVANALSS